MMVVMDSQVAQGSLEGMVRKAIVGCMAEMVVMDCQALHVPGRVGQKGDQGLRGFPGRVGQKGHQGLRGPPGRSATSSRGVVYTRWGKRTFPTGTALVYSGRVGGSWYTVTKEGQQTTSVCQTILTKGFSQVHGTEYETHSSPLSAVHDHNATCAVCHASTRTIVLRIPAKTGAHPPGLWNTLAT